MLILEEAAEAVVLTTAHIHRAVIHIIQAVRRIVRRVRHHRTIPADLIIPAAIMVAEDQAADVCLLS